MKKGKILKLLLVSVFAFLCQKEVLAGGEEKEIENGLGQRITAEEDVMFRDGDIAGFIGDSITHAEYTDINYVEFLYQYYLSRFPDREIEFRTLGTNGYTVRNVLETYDRDPAFRGINRAVILLGMNEALQEISVEAYIADMERLITRLKEDGLRGGDILVLSPTPYDQTCALNYDKNGHPYQTSDDRLSAYTEQLEVKTAEWGVQYIDLHTPLKKLYTEVQREDAKQTLTRGDCIHPGASAHMMMAYEILKGLGAGEGFSEITISEEQKKGAENVYRSERGIRLTWKPERLPAFASDEFLELCRQIPSAEGFGREMLRAEGLLQGAVYEAALGDCILGSFTGGELAEGIELAAGEGNPLQNAARAIHEKTKKRQKLGAEYRSAVYAAAEAGTEEAWEQLKETWEGWQSADQKMRREIEELAKEAVSKTYTITITAEGYSREALELEAGPEEAFLFEDGDVVGFIGDSITRISYSGISYPEFLQQYYITRYPQWKLEFRNLGTGYYTAENARKLYNGESGIRDASLEGITKAVIMFGMNEALDGVEAEVYIKNIRGLIEVLNQQGIPNENIILTASTPFDQTRSSNYLENGEQKDTVDNSIMEYTKKLRELSGELGTHYVDLHTPLLWATGVLQERNADATLTIDDNIHPKAEGSILAGTFFLHQQGAGKEVARVRIFKGKETQAENAEVGQVEWKGGDDYVRFTYQPHSLPMAATGELEEVEAYFSVMDWISLEELQIEGLKEDETYTVYMDKVPVGDYTGKQLGAGVNLAGCILNPGQMAAAEIETLNQAWHDSFSEYRKVLEDATLGERSAGQEDVNAAYEICKERTEKLGKQMYEIARTSAARTYLVEVAGTDGRRIFMRLDRWKWVILAALGSFLAAAVFAVIRWRRKRQSRRIS